LANQPFQYFLPAYYIAASFLEASPGYMSQLWTSFEEPPGSQQPSALKQATRICQTATAMKHPLLFCLLLAISMLQAQEYSIPFERDSNYSASYQETIAFYEQLAKASPQLKLQAEGGTDAGYPLHLAIVAADSAFTPERAKDQDKLVLFVNNAIHPGEPCGVDATMLLLRDLLQKGEGAGLLKDIVLLAVPFYNIGGGLRRGRDSRANQVGPRLHGFRGNARNLDLNRDFIKCDSRNAQTFNRLFARWQPDVFIDNHTSNGADYPYTITLIASQADKLNPHLASYMNDSMLPGLYAGMQQAGWEMTPYVYARSTPEEGIAGFLDLPRYGSGYAALHNTISFIVETHMLKPFKNRVQSTYAFMQTVLQQMQRDKDAIRQARQKAIAHTIEQDTFALNWALDRQRSDTILFKGYTARYKPSEVSGLQRLYYDRKAPYTKPIPYFRYYKTTAVVRKPAAYIIPQAYHGVIERLRWNGVELHRLAEAIRPEVELYRMEDYQTVERAYEGHYLHYDIQPQRERRAWAYRPGDYVVFANQPQNRYIVETLEPHAPDSFFAWNFFDGILMQKEYFSAYLFEDEAARLLRENPGLRDALEQRRAEDEDFAASARAQLNFIYERSPYYEPTYQLYPVGRLMEAKGLPLEKN